MCKKENRTWEGRNESEISPSRLLRYSCVMLCQNVTEMSGKSMIDQRIERVESCPRHGGGAVTVHVTTWISAHQKAEQILLATVNATVNISQYQSISVNISQLVCHALHSTPPLLKRKWPLGLCCNLHAEVFQCNRKAKHLQKKCENFGKKISLSLSLFQISSKFPSLPTLSTNVFLPIRFSN